MQWIGSCRLIGSRGRERCSAAPFSPFYCWALHGLPYGLVHPDVGVRKFALDPEVAKKRMVADVGARIGAANTRA